MLTQETPSRWQVRQPVYARSVDRWKAYEEHLPGLDADFRGIEEAAPPA